MTTVPEHIAESLLKQAGLPISHWKASPLSDVGDTNLMWLLTLENRTCTVLRVYKWPHSGGDFLQRARKEQALHQVLKSHGVPVAPVLAIWDQPDESAVLMAFLPGKLLGDIAHQVSPEAHRQAWFDAGGMLRRAHDIMYPAGKTGWIAGEHIQPFSEGGWSDFILYEALRHGQRLAERGINIDLESVSDLLTRAAPLLERRPNRLLHNDPHPWNVLVDCKSNVCRCSGWLDWEYAMVGDPVWDLVRMDIFRLKPIGSTPSAFYAGYGRQPEEPFRSIYELSIMFWLADEYLDGLESGIPDAERSMLPTYRSAMAYIEEFDAILPQLVFSP